MPFVQIDVAMRASKRLLHLPSPLLKLFAAGARLHGRSFCSDRDAVCMETFLPGRARNLVLKAVRMGVIELEHIADEDMRALAQWVTRAERLRAEIERLQARRQRRRLAVVMV